MIDEYFEMFIEEIGSASKSRRVPDETIGKYRTKLPTNLLDLWREDGWSAYGEGLVWTVDPAEYDHLVESWLAGTPFEKKDNYYTIARTAFGDLYLWGENTHSVVSICCVGNYINKGSDEDLNTSLTVEKLIGIFFSNRYKDDFDIEDEYGEFLFEQLIDKVGSLEYDELYAFEPALIIGGTLNADNVKKRNLDVHLSILRGFANPVLNE